MCYVVISWKSSKKYKVALGDKNGYYKKNNDL